MTLFYGDVDYIIQLASIEPMDLQCDDEQELKSLVSDILQRLKSHIDSRLSREVSMEEMQYDAIQDIAERSVIDILNYAQQLQMSDIVSRDEMAVYLVHAADALEKLDDKLAPFQGKESQVKITWTGRDRDADNNS